MYKGHFMLLLTLAIILLVAFIVSRKKNKIFTYTCWGITVVFLLMSVRYYYDVFIYNPTPEGFKLTWSMHLLTQNEDFIARNGRLLGLFWGSGIMIASFILGMFSLKHQEDRYFA